MEEIKLEKYELYKLELKPNDIVVIFYEGKLSLENVESIKEQVSKVIKDNQILVLEGGLRLGVLGGIDGK